MPSVINLEMYKVEYKRRSDIKELIDNTLIRLDDFTQYPEDEEDRRGGLLIELSLTRYSHR
jgi:hypothetical protein